MGLMLESYETWGPEEGIWRAWGCPPVETPLVTGKSVIATANLQHSSNDEGRPPEAHAF